jgi:hypothetical protein
VSALLAIALGAVVALSVTVVMLATRDQAPAAPAAATAPAAAPASVPVEPVGTRYDGGPDEGTRGPGH